MRALVCGGRTFGYAKHQQELIFTALDWVHSLREISELIHGAASGADSFAGLWARRNSISETPMSADWHRYGRRAGSLRNEQMIGRKPDLVIAFPGGAGTTHMRSLALRTETPYITYGEHSLFDSPIYYCKARQLLYSTEHTDG